MTTFESLLSFIVIVIVLFNALIAKNETAAYLLLKARSFYKSKIIQSLEINTSNHYLLA
jgi:hypothetical protein